MATNVVFNNKNVTFNGKNVVFGEITPSTEEVTLFEDVSFATDIRAAGGANTKNSYNVAGLDSNGVWAVDFDVVKAMRFAGQVVQFRGSYGGDTNINVRVIILVSDNGTSGWTTLATVFNSNMGPDSTYNLNHVYKNTSLTGTKYISIQLQYNGNGTTFGGKATVTLTTQTSSNGTYWDK